MANRRRRYSEIVGGLNESLGEKHIPEKDSLKWQNLDAHAVEDEFLCATNIGLAIARVEYYWGELVNSYCKRKNYDYEAVMKKYGFNIGSLAEVLPQPEGQAVLDEVSENVLGTMRRIQRSFDKLPFENYSKLTQSREKVARHLRARVAKQPTGLKQIFCTIHGDYRFVDDNLVYQILGIRKDSIERSIDFERLKQEFGDEDFCLEYFDPRFTIETKIPIIAEFIDTVKPTEHDVVWDLGAFYGIIGIYGALTTPACYRCVEIVPERVKESRRIQKKFGIENVEFILKDVKNVDFSDGTIFYLFNPFSYSTLLWVGDVLHEIADSRPEPIKIGVNNDEYCYFARENWLEPISPNTNPIKLVVYQSR